MNEPGRYYWTAVETICPAVEGRGASRSVFTRNPSAPIDRTRTCSDRARSGLRRRCVCPSIDPFQLRHDRNVVAELTPATSVP